MAVKKMMGKVEYKDNLAGGVWSVRLKLTESVYFVPGQYVSVRVTDEGERRSYSVASLPSVMGGEERDFIDLLIDVSPMGVGSRYFLELKVGDTVEILGFMGKFAVDETAIKNEAIFLFIATGTGIAPIRPMIENILTAKGFAGQVILVWGMRQEKDMYWMEELERLKRDNENFEFDLVLSHPALDWPGNRGHVGDVVDGLKLDWGKVWTYLCGAPEMIEEMRQTLGKKGVPDERLVHEKYA